MFTGKYEQERQAKLENHPDIQTSESLRHTSPANSALPAGKGRTFGPSFYVLFVNLARYQPTAIIGLVLCNRGIQIRRPLVHSPFISTST
ncbi:hypothetical protein M413DRAFT_447676 [Hebeloma cylindrosporum]|uniref:Uncharacterized protein n=1 Tax=Hebeloma cylindrosporum TaxID=76867 RepID=A0A0C3C564_HEBCY|nr:hypothetical protein M413DRAFT_447676 [Hebeloma cylindrosporum h7]